MECIIMEEELLGPPRKLYRLLHSYLLPLISKRLCICVWRHDRVEPIGKLRAGMQPSFPETGGQAQGLQNEGGNSSGRTPGEGSKRQVLLTISQLHVSHSCFVFLPFPFGVCSASRDSFFGLQTFEILYRILQILFPKNCIYTQNHIQFQCFLGFFGLHLGANKLQ